MRFIRVAAAAAAVCAGVLSGALLVGSAQASPTPQPIPKAGAGGKVIRVPADSVTFALGTSDGSRGDGRNSYNWTIAPGRSTFDYAVAYNVSKKPLTLRVLPVDAITDTTGYLYASPTNAKPRLVGRWIHSYLQTVKIPPLNSVIIPFKVTVPKNAAVGDHGGAFVVATIPSVSQDSKGRTVIKRETRLAMPIYVRVAGPLKTEIAFSSIKASFKTQTFRPGFGDVTVNYSIVNTGNVRVGVLQQLQLKGFIGSPTRVANPSPVAQILPGNTYKGTVVFKHVPAALSIRVRVTATPRPLDPGSPNGVPAVASTSVAAVSWSAMALASMGVTIIVLLVLVGLQLAGGAGHGLLKSKKSAEPEMAAAGAKNTSGESQ